MLPLNGLNPVSVESQQVSMPSSMQFIMAYVVLGLEISEILLVLQLVTRGVIHVHPYALIVAKIRIFFFSYIYGWNLLLTKP